MCAPSFLPPFRSNQQSLSEQRELLEEKEVVDEKPEHLTEKQLNEVSIAVEVFGMEKVCVCACVHMCVCI